MIGIIRIKASSYVRTFSDMAGEYMRADRIWDTDENDREYGRRRKKRCEE